MGAQGILFMAVAPDVGDELYGRLIFWPTFWPKLWVGEIFALDPKLLPLPKLSISRVEDILAMAGRVIQPSTMTRAWTLDVGVIFLAGPMDFSPIRPISLTLAGFHHHSGP